MGILNTRERGLQEITQISAQLWDSNDIFNHGERHDKCRWRKVIRRIREAKARYWDDRRKEKTWFVFGSSLNCVKSRSPFLGKLGHEIFGRNFSPTFKNTMETSKYWDFVSPWLIIQKLSKNRIILPLFSFRTVAFQILQQNCKIQRPNLISSQTKGREWVHFNYVQ